MLYEMLTETVLRYPDAVAIEAGDERLSYRDLLQRVDHMAATLAAKGIQAGAKVLLLLPNGPDYPAAVFGVARLGGVVVPINHAYQAKELRFYLDDSRASAVITTADLRTQHAALIEEVCPGCVVLTPAEARETSLGHTNGSRQSVRGEGLYQYSSGSTGTPKRVPRTQENLVREAENFVATTGINAADRILTVVPLFHAHGFGNCMLAAARTGATLVILPSFNPQRVMTTLREGRITVYPGVPFMFAILADSASIDACALPQLRLAFSAGAPLSEDTHRGFLAKYGVPVRQLYGSTETGSVAINLRDTEHGRWASVGAPIHNVQVDLFDEQGRPVPSDESGEIVIRSPAMTTGYANLEDVNRETFRDGAFWTGDLGHRDQDGYLFITGRTRLFINAGGNKVDPAEIETVVMQHPAVKECVVVGIKGQYGHEVIKAVVVPKAECSADDIKDWCSSRLVEFKMPRLVEFREEIPRSPLGKILRKYLQTELGD